MTACINSVVKILTNLLWLTGTFSRPAVVKVSGFSMNVCFPLSQRQESHHLCPSPCTPVRPWHSLLLLTEWHWLLRLILKHGLFELFPLLHVQEKKYIVLLSSHKNSLFLPLECIHARRRRCNCACVGTGSPGECPG